VLIEKFSRFFLRHEISFRACRDAGPALTLVDDEDGLDVVSALRNSIGTEDAQLQIKGRDFVELTRVEVREQEGVCVLLFRRSDLDAATPIFEDVDTRLLRRPDRRESEAVAVSAHLFIQLAPLPIQPPRHRAILEEIPGLGRTYVQEIIGQCLRKNVYQYRTHRREEKETYSIPTLAGLPSESLGEAIRDGAIRRIELVRPGTIEGLDCEGIVVAKDQRMTLEVHMSPENARNTLNVIRRWSVDHNWADVRVHLSLPDDRSRVVSIAREADAADVLFVRSQLVHVQNELPVCTDAVNADLLGKARAMFEDQSGW
jgi:hypothetical protein